MEVASSFESDYRTIEKVGVGQSPKHDGNDSARGGAEEVERL